MSREFLKGMKEGLVVAVVMWLVGCAVYLIGARGMRFSTNAEQFGPFLMKPHYESFFFAFSDGKVFDPKSQSWRSVVYDGPRFAPTNFHFGYRLVPRYSHASVAEFMKRTGATELGSPSPRPSP